MGAAELLAAPVGEEALLHIQVTGHPVAHDLGEDVDVVVCGQRHLLLEGPLCDGDLAGVGEVDEGVDHLRGEGDELDLLGILHHVVEVGRERSHDDPVNRDLRPVPGVQSHVDELPGLLQPLHGVAVGGDELLCAVARRVPVVKKGMRAIGVVIIITTFSIITMIVLPIQGILTIIIIIIIKYLSFILEGK